MWEVLTRGTRDNAFHSNSCPSKTFARAAEATYRVAHHHNRTRGYPHEADRNAHLSERQLKVDPQTMSRIHTPTPGVTMATSPILALIDSRINEALRKAKSRPRNNDEKGKGLRSTRTAVRQQTTIGSYIYAIIVDGVVRYIGKGRNGRMYTHLIEAKRTSARCPTRTAHLYPRMHRKLVETVRAGSEILETVITSGLTDQAAYRLESRMIGEFHKFRAGQLWNTIDERFLDPRYLPDEWDDPEHPLYRLPRPLGNPRFARGRARS